MHPVLTWLVTALAALGLDLRDRDSVEVAIDGLIALIKRVAAFTSNTWDDAAVALLEAAWSLNSERIIDAIIAFLETGNEAPLAALSAEIFKT